MGKTLVSQMIPTLRKLKLSDTEALTTAGYQAFEVGRDKVDSYRGDPRTLGDALRVFQTANSSPYECAGIAYTLVVASRESDGSYYQPGLEEALAWLEKAQAVAPDAIDINVIEPLIYVYGGRLDDARLVLDYLHEQANEHYYLYRTEMDYWQEQGDLEKALAWSQRAMEAAETVPQRLRLKGRVGDMYMALGQVDRALETYKEALHFDPDNAELWHRASMAEWQREDYAEAARLNRKALELNPQLISAQKLREALDEREEESSSGGLFGRFLG